MRLLLLVSLSLVFHSCTVYRPYPDLKQNNLTSLEFIPHNNDVEMFFSGETEPEKDYIRVALLKEVRTGYSESQGRLLRALQSKAKQAGADAVIVMGTTESVEVFEDITTDRIRSIPRNHMWGIAIRYVDNLEAGLNVLSHVTIETQGDIAIMDGGRIDVDSNGEFNNMPSDKWSKFVYLHSYEYLVENRRSWGVVGRFPSNGFARKQVRRFPARGPVQTKVAVDYWGSGRVGNLGISYLDGLGARINMSIRYDKDQRISKREWIDSTNIRYLTNRIYSAAGQLLREDYQRQRPGEELQPFLSVKYEYLSPEDLSQKLKEVQVVKGRQP
ncbi:MAG: hypothetical protein AAFO03_06125 [Bacteroidota bacterium]